MSLLMLKRWEQRAAAARATYERLESAIALLREDLKPAQLKKVATMMNGALHAHAAGVQHVADAPRITRRKKKARKVHRRQVQLTPRGSVKKAVKKPKSINKAALMARRALTAEFLAKFDQVTPRPALNGLARGVGTLIRHGLLKKTPKGYLRTAKPFTIEKHHKPKVKGAWVAK